MFEMTVEAKSLLASVALHLLVLGGAAWLSAFSGQPQEPILIDFTVEQRKQEQEMRTAAGAAAAPVARRQSVRQPSPAAAHAAVAVPQYVRPVAAGAAETAEPAPTPVQPAGAGAAVTGAAAGGSGKAVQAGHGSSGGGEGAEGARSGISGESAEVLRARYVKEHFAYIRDVIAGNLRYPGKALRMGWSGRLAVEFVVQESGAVDGIRIVHSSGVPLLDSDAAETVRRSAPFPRPPVSARLIIPMEYVLE